MFSAPPHAAAAVVFVVFVTHVAALLVTATGRTLRANVFYQPHHDTGLASNEAQPSESQCPDSHAVYPSWPTGFDVGVNAVFIVGEQKSGTTWLWEMLIAHPCIISPGQPHPRTGAITAKETYFFTKSNVSTDAREFLLPWMKWPAPTSTNEGAWEQIDNTWFEAAKSASVRGTATRAEDFRRRRTLVGPATKLEMQTCSRYYILEATPHYQHTTIAADRIRKLFPDAHILSLLKEPAHRMHSAYNQFGKFFKTSCKVSTPAAWCPIFRYYQLRLPTFAEVAAQELAYISSQGCTFHKPEEQKKDWMTCFGCMLMDPWKWRFDAMQHIRYQAYPPSAALGMYAPMLQEWLKRFPSDHMMVMNYGELVKRPFELVNSILERLGLERYSVEHWSFIRPEGLGFRGHYAPGEKDDGLERTLQMLRAFFKPLNDQLDALLASHNISWSSFDNYETWKA